MDVEQGELILEEWEKRAMRRMESERERKNWEKKTLEGMMEYSESLEQKVKDAEEKLKRYTAEIKEFVYKRELREKAYDEDKKWHEQREEKQKKKEEACSSNWYRNNTLLEKIENNTRST